MEYHNLYEVYTLDKLLRELNRIEYLTHPKFGFTLGEITAKQKDLFKQVGITEATVIPRPNFRDFRMYNN